MEISMYRMIPTLLALALTAAMVHSEDWPQWRGPNGNGVSPETGLPVTWSEDENIAWRAELAGSGLSSPIVFGERVFVTSQVGRGDVRPGNHPTLGQGGEFAEERSMPGASRDDVVFLVEAFRTSDGRRLWQYELTAESTDASFPEVHR
jgi:hypothetical protein